jgi:hypothetical protein
MAGAAWGEGQEPAAGEGQERPQGAAAVCQGAGTKERASGTVLRCRTASGGPVLVESASTREAAEDPANIPRASGREESRLGTWCGSA